METVSFTDLPNDAEFSFSFDGAKSNWVYKKVNFNGNENLGTDIVPIVVVRTPQHSNLRITLCSREFMAKSMVYPR